MQQSKITAVLFAMLNVAIAGHAAFADTTTLYDGSAAGGTQTPDQQDWLYLTNPPNIPPVFTPLATQSASGGLTELNATFDRGEQAGYFTHNPFTGAIIHDEAPILDPVTGFTLSFSLQVIAEGHDMRDDNNDGEDDRAGMSVIVVTSNGQNALELGFWENEIWAYEDGTSVPGDLFTHAEGVAHDTTALNDYHLTVIGNSYELFSGANSLLTGSMRDYTSWPGLSVPVFGTLDPYEQANMIFLGDDTSSADAHIRLGHVSVTILPEPASAAMLMIGATAIITRRRQRSIQR